MKKIAFYAGSFDPFTKGHLAVVCEALCHFDTVIIGVGVNPLKETLFSVGERKKLILSSIEDFKQLVAHRVLSRAFIHGVEADAAQRLRDEPDCLQVVAFSDLTVDAALRCSASTLIRGVRNDEDKAAEKKLAVINEQLLAVRHRKLNQVQIQVPHSKPELKNVSSSVVKSLFKVGEYVAAMDYVMPSVHNAMSRHHLKGHYCASLNGKLSESWNALDKVYSTARNYHTLSHLAYCLNYVQIFYKLSSEDLLKKDKNCLDLALFWHDYCLEDNKPEEKSAKEMEAYFRGQVCSVQARNLSVPQENLEYLGGHSAINRYLEELGVFRAQKLILATKHNTKSAPTDLLEQLIHDVDLAILGDNANYGTYAMQVRLENAEYPTKKYAKARIKFLQSLLDKERLFLTDFFYEMLEKTARANIDHEISFWQNGY